jgi:CHAT domain-containing protein
VPWETLSIGAWTPATAAGLSRRYAAENLSLARWSESRRLGATLDVLLVANPTENLPGANAEAQRLLRVLADRENVRLHVVQGAQATKQRLLDYFRSGAFDVLHYAGHAHFDPIDPGKSGIICAGGEILCGGDLSNLHSLPALVFFNACETGRLRGSNPRNRARRALAATDGLAEAFLRGGVANYLGTYWPVGDEAAMAFSTAFYSSLVQGFALGSAVNRGRAAVRAARSCDWADYMHYGSHDFVIKTA